MPQNEDFSEELNIIQQINEVCEDETYSDHPLYQRFKELAPSYEDLFREHKIVMRASDRLEKSLRKRNEEIEKLNEIIYQINMSLDINEIFTNIFNYLSDNYGFEACALAIYYVTENQYRIEKFLGPSFLNDYISKCSGSQFPLDDEGGMISQCIKENKIILLEKQAIYYQHKSELSVFGKDSNYTEHPVKLALFIPILINNTVIGSLCLMTHNKSLNLNASDKKSIQTFTNHVAAMVRNSKLFADLERDRLRLIQENYLKLKELNKSIERFIPREPIKLLHKKSIEHVELKDQINVDMTIMFVDIRSFTSISEKITPAQTFDMLTIYTKQISPVIRNHNGFIDTYIGDGIMALFPEKVDDAVMAAINMQNEMDNINIDLEAQGYDQIKIGIGIHFGNVTLGIIGEEDRLQVTVISDAVNLASRVEQLTKQYNSPIIVTEGVLSRLEEKVPSKSLGEVEVKGREEMVSIFSILS
ncbi:MAG: GAF domain-containing protein [Spirochaetota bacterium]|nr:GAF domain-containing protein [Spirochaetota bacterium]